MKNGTMKAARLFGPRELKMLEVPLPALGRGDVLCKVSRAGLCGTDYAIYSGEFSFVKQGGVVFPFTPGHEWSGTVAAVGASVSRFAVGDRVVGDTCVSCGACVACLLGDYLRCEKVRCVGTVNAWDGGFAEYTVFPERHLFHLPDEVSWDAGVFVEPAATALHAVRDAGVESGDTVLIQGAGPLGLLAAKLSKIAGAAHVVVAGRSGVQLEIARSFGADDTVNTVDEVLEAGVLRRTGGRPVDRVIEASGAPELFASALRLVRPGGVISAVSFYSGPIAALEIDKLVFGNIRLKGSSGSIGMYQPVLRLMAAGALDVAPLISRRYAFREIEQAYEAMGTAGDHRVKWLVEFD